VKNRLNKIFLILFWLGLISYGSSQKISSIYGLTFGGGLHSIGALFRYDSLTASDTALISFQNNGYYPKGNVMQASNGLLYGMTWRGGNDDEGVIFSYDLAKDKYAELYDFDGTHGSNPYGNSLIQASNGLLYGMTLHGGAFGYGVIFSFDLATNKESVLVNFNDTNGANPFGSLVQASDGMLYGMTSTDITGNGLVFKYNPLNGHDTVLMIFNSTNGDNPQGSLIQASNGLLYGMTEAGGSSNGVIFSYNIVTHKDSVCLQFNSINGSQPEGSLVQASDGLLYGMANGGGLKGLGVVFRFNPVTGQDTVLVNFNGNNGETPYGSLIQSTSGFLYGMTTSGGTIGDGVMFSYNPILKKDSVIINFNGINGNTPYADVIEPMTAKIVIRNSKLLCYGDSIGAAKILVKGAAKPVVYTWSNGGTIDSVYELKAGNYSASVKDGKGIVYSFNFSVSQPPKLKDSIVSLTNIMCYGDNNGAIAMNVTGGTKPYSFLWSPGGQTVLSINNLGAGSYSFTSTDSNKCVSPITINVTQPPLLKDSIDSLVNVLCSGGNNGSVRIAVHGGVLPYTYQWVGKLGQVGIDSLLNNLYAGGYTCTVTDAHSCVTSTSIVIKSPSPLKDSTTYTSTPCTKSTGSAAVVMVTGGVYPYSYLWSPGSNTNTSDTGLTSGSYTCTITDSNKCIQKTIVVVPNTGGPRDSIITSTNETCYGQSIGSASAGVKGGYLPYVFKWTPSGGNKTAAANLPAATYTFSVTDSIGCVSTATIDISEPTKLVDSTIKVINVSCFGFNNGRIEIGTKGGVPPYNYVWSNGSGDADSAINLVAGSYSCTITDSNNCNAPAQVIAITSPMVLSTDTMATATKCGTSNGSASVVSIGGTRPYTYLWSNSGSDSTITNVAGGITYSCQITDANGCINKVNIIVPDTGGPKDTIVLNNSINCYGNNNGSAIANVVKGTAPFTYSWSPSSAGTNQFAINLVAGGYTCTITDATGCKGSSAINISQPGQITYSFVTVGVCYGANSGGSAVVKVAGGIPPYTFNWSSLGSTTDSLENIGPGSYVCTILDSNKCKIDAICSITEASKLTLTIVSTPASCSTCNDGTVQVFPSGGIPSGDSTYYLYVWDSIVNNSSIHNLDTGTYHVCVTTNYCPNESVCDSAQVIAGINPISSLTDAIQIYPNPSNGLVKVQVPEWGSAIISVFDEMGKLIYRKAYDGGLSRDGIDLDISACINGIYTLRIETIKAVVNKKMIIQK
jgi:uncharacterized repeat protein (TIGR03803 family)